MSLPAARTTTTTIQDINNWILPHPCPDRYLTSVLSSSSIMDLAHTFTPSTHSSPVLPSHLCSHCVYCFLYFSRQSPVLLCFLSSMCSHPNSPSIPITSFSALAFVQLVWLCQYPPASALMLADGFRFRWLHLFSPFTPLFSVYSLTVRTSMVLCMLALLSSYRVLTPFSPSKYPINQAHPPSICYLQKPLANAFACTNHSFMRVECSSLLESLSFYITFNGGGSILCRYPSSTSIA